MRTNEPEVWKGIVAGAVAGLAATWIMTQFQNGWNKAQQKLQERRSGGQSDAEQETLEVESEDARMKAAGAIARTVFRKELTFEQKKRLGPVMHYGLGTVFGAVYGGVSERFPRTSAGWGSGYGSAIFIGADEVAVPLFGLGPSPKETPLPLHFYAWASHLIYGVTLESLRRSARFALGYTDPYIRTKRATREAYERISDFTDVTKRRSRSQWKSGLKSAEKAFRRMRKAA